MEVILKKDFISLGYEGDICKVKDGYARKTAMQEITLFQEI